MNSKIEPLQVLRAFAAIFVVLNHLWGTSKTALSSALGLDFIGGFGVDAFFILSGFIMCYTTSDSIRGGGRESLNFLIRRIERIYPIFLIASFPFIVKYIISSHDFNLYQIIGNVLLLPSFTNDPSYHIFVFPAWTLVYEMFFYVIFSTSILLFKVKTKIIFCSSFFIFILVLFVNFFLYKVNGINGSTLVI